MKKVNFLFLVGFLIALNASVAFSDTTYYRVLTDQRISTLKDACHVITIFLGKEKELKDFQSEFSYLQSQNIVSKHMKADPAQTLHKDDLSYMVFQVLHLRGGVMLNALKPFVGVTPRYAYKECVYQKLIVDENPKSIVDGKELLSVLSRMSEFQAASR